MKKTLIFIAICILTAISCKGDNSGDTIEEKLLNYQKAPGAAVFDIMGKVKCSACRADSVMSVNLEAEDGQYLISSMWKGYFTAGEYKITDVTLNFGDTIFVRVFIDDIYPSGKLSDSIVVPGDNKSFISAPLITIP